MNKRPQILRYLLQTKNDLDVNAQGDRGETPLHDVVVNGYSKVMTALLDFGARTDIRDNIGRTPLRAAREANQPDIFRMMAQAQKKEEQNTKALHKENIQASISLGIAHKDTLDFDEPLPNRAALRIQDAAGFTAYLQALGDDMKTALNQPDNDLRQTAVQIAVVRHWNDA